MNGNNHRKLFELLAIEKDLSSRTTESAKETTSRFSNADNFLGITTHFAKLLEDQPDFQDEYKPLSGNVDYALGEYLEHLGLYIDTTIEKESANTTAFSDVILEGEKFLENWSATALLNLESRLDELHKVYSAIPTLPDSEIWTFDSAKGCYVSQNRKQLRTVKTQKAIVLYEATKEHPAQVQLVSTDVPAYEVERTLYSGMLTLSDKKSRIDRIEKLQRAVKQARQRANTVETQPKEVAKKIFDYINGK